MACAPLPPEVAQGQPTVHPGGEKRARFCEILRFISGGWEILEKTFPLLYKFLYNRFKQVPLIRGFEGSGFSKKCL